MGQVKDRCRAGWPGDTASGFSQSALDQYPLMICHLLLQRAHLLVSEANLRFVPGVMIVPGLMTLTRVLRPFRRNVLTSCWEIWQRLRPEALGLGALPSRRPQCEETRRCRRGAETPDPDATGYGKLKRPLSHSPGMPLAIARVLSEYYGRGSERWYI